MLGNYLNTRPYEHKSSAVDFKIGPRHTSTNHIDLQAPHLPSLKIQLNFGFSLNIRHHLLLLKPYHQTLPVRIIHHLPPHPRLRLHAHHLLLLHRERRHCPRSQPYISFIHPHSEPRPPEFETDLPVRIPHLHPRHRVHVHVRSVDFVRHVEFRHSEGLQAEDRRFRIVDEVDDCRRHQSREDQDEDDDPENAAAVAAASSATAAAAEVWRCVLKRRRMNLHPWRRLYRYRHRLARVLETRRFHWFKWFRHFFFGSVSGFSFVLIGSETKSSN
ncbi:uncharacterized protein G2W53_017307 [Senna tora]|uniref:Uncharacterized protein n=1 Tax=Senna tora TaxID=362788 RepID=A0A834WMA9_9FABA|nr:uncharacterized protein G2W53_017307 [Senna tora]